MPPRAASRPEYPTYLSLDDAQALVRRLCASRRLPVEPMDLQHAFGRVLAIDIVAPHDLPPFANSAMDGYALRGADLPTRGERAFPIAGQVLAGAATALHCAAGECVRITTGAPLPGGADSVVIKENVRLERDTAIIAAGERAGANVRPAGEDYRAGDIALRAGDVLSAPRLGVLAACGQAQVAVARRPRVGVLVTGDELVAPEQPLGFGQIHDSNRYSLGGLLRGIGIEPAVCAHVRDDPQALKAALLEASRHCDVLISSGGVSAGEADFLPNLIAGLGTVHFWKVRMKPGMPALCGGIGDALVFALPGNPVSTIAAFLTLVQPALFALQEANASTPRRWKARLASALAKRHDRTEFLRARVESRDDGALWAEPLRQQGSAMLRGVAEADALVIVPAHVHELAIGATVEVLPLPGLC